MPKYAHLIKVGNSFMLRLLPAETNGFSASFCLSVLAFTYRHILRFFTPTRKTAQRRFIDCLSSWGKPSLRLVETHTHTHTETHMHTPPPDTNNNFQPNEWCQDVLVSVHACVNVCVCAVKPSGLYYHRTCQFFESGCSVA